MPTSGGVVLSLERLNRILEIDEENLLAVVQPAVITGDLQAAVEARGLFYPPDPQSLKESSIGGNVAECAGGPRAFKYGVTKRYVLALEAVLPTGEIIRTGSKAVKNVVGYDLTQLLVGSEGTLAIITEITLRLIPKPPAVATLRACFPDVPIGGARRDRAAAAPRRAGDARADGCGFAAGGRGLCRRAAGAGRHRRAAAARSRWLPGGDRRGGRSASTRHAARPARSKCCARANDDERAALWRVRRETSYALRTIAGLKINNDVVVPRGRVPELMALVERLRADTSAAHPVFRPRRRRQHPRQHHGIDPEDADEVARARQAVGELFAGVVALEGSISGEHGIGFSKAPYIGLELSPDVIALSKRVKAAFDPHGILNPGKIFPPLGHSAWATWATWRMGA